MANIKPVVSRAMEDWKTYTEVGNLEEMMKQILKNKTKKAPLRTRGNHENDMLREDQRVVPSKIDGDEMMKTVGLGVEKDSTEVSLDVDGKTTIEELDSPANLPKENKNGIEDCKHQDFISQDNEETSDKLKIISGHSKDSAESSSGSCGAGTAQKEGVRGGDAGTRAPQPGELGRLERPLSMGDEGRKDRCLATEVGRTVVWRRRLEGPLSGDGGRKDRSLATEVRRTVVGKGGRKDHNRRAMKGGKTFVGGRRREYSGAGLWALQRQTLWFTWI
ncbi:hypothetical protein M5K25_009582 [Dendrobium thyrsiflorum]|uniref:Uncharacterized protein n=1 Tax=Dendrobium thyrsiflorum TaxID=117978 RepID=A0ABD0V5Z0_DENTH